MKNRNSTQYSVGLAHARPNYARKQMQSTKFRGYCGWAVAGLQARDHKVDQGLQILWDQQQNFLLLAWCSVS